MPLASLPSTREAMRRLPGVCGVKVKLADSPGSSPRCGFGVDHDGSTGEVSVRPATTAQEFGTVPRFSHCTVTCQPMGTVSTSAPDA